MMKFKKKYEEYIKEREGKVPVIGFKNHKKTLEKCWGSSIHQPISPHQCPECDGTLFPTLMKEMKEVVKWFNEQAQELLDQHSPTGLVKYYRWFKYKLIKGQCLKDHGALIRECQHLINYAGLNAIAFDKILKKYDKVRHSKQGQAFKTRAQHMHIDLLHSPWLLELLALHINLHDKHPELGGRAHNGPILRFTDGKPSIAWETFLSIKLEIDLTCPICLDILFDAVCLKCGHILCFVCACSAASTSIVDGLNTAAPRQKCPLCRKARVYEGTVRLEELNVLLSKRCSEYWKQRLESERVERIQKAKEHYDSICRAFMGA